MADTAPAAKDLPSTPSGSYTKRQPQWSRLRTLYGGTDCVHAAGASLLIKFTGESDADFKRRATQTAFTNFFRRTVRAMTGLLFRIAPKLGKDVPAQLAAHWEDIDGGGTHGIVFARDLVSDGLVTGLGGILVDYPEVAAPMRLDEEWNAGLRPYWVRYRAEDVLVARSGRVGTRTTWTLVVLRECETVDDGAFGEAVLTRYRVFRHRPDTGVTYELWEDRPVPGGAPGTIAPMQVTPPQPMRGKGGRPLSAIPFSAFVAGETDGSGLVFDCDPPLLDMADLNLDHYRVRSDRRNVMTLACTVTPYRIGVPEGTPGMRLGPSAGIDIPDTNGKVGFLEIAGTAFGPTREELQDIVREMAALALAFLEGDRGAAAETAEAKKLDAAAQNASLATVAQALQDCLERALAFHAEYLGVDSGGSLTVNQDFEAAGLTPQMLAALNACVIGGTVDPETFHLILAGARMLPDGVEPADIARRLEEQAAKAHADAVELAGAMKSPVADPGDMNDDDAPFVAEAA